MYKEESKEKRNYKISVRNCAGNAGKTSKQYSIGLPSKWMHTMGITPEKRNVVISFDGTEIRIRKLEGNE